VYAGWLPEEAAWRGVDWLDDARPSATPAQPAQKIAVGENVPSPYRAVVSRVGTRGARGRINTGFGQIRGDD
jgi:hypothetical protein